MNKIATTISAAAISALSAATAFAQTTPALNEAFQDGIKNEINRQARLVHQAAVMKHTECTTRNTVFTRHNEDVMPAVRALSAIMTGTEGKLRVTTTESGPTAHGIGTIVRASYNSATPKTGAETSQGSSTHFEKPAGSFLRGSMVDVSKKELVISVVPVPVKGSSAIEAQIIVRDFSKSSYSDVTVTKGAAEITQLMGIWAARVAPETAQNLAKEIPVINSGVYLSSRELSDCGPYPLYQGPKF